jgi:type I restriction/modification enzyme
MEKLLKELKNQIVAMNKANASKYNLSDEILDNLYSVYPFNKFEYIISHLIGTDTITLQQYLDIRNSYLERNKYLYVFEITAPRTFGETWAQRHLNEVVPELQRPSTLNDPEYSGQYDFWYNGIRIEVKASRAVRRKSGDSLIIKALSSDSKYGFDMNFQQIKPACCDVFVWIAVWRDAIRYWVLSSDEVKSNSYYSPGQHRGNVGEGQLWLKDTNIDDFNEYEVGVREILSKIVEKGKR